MKHLTGYPYGETLRNASVCGFTLTEQAYAPILALPKHAHEQADFCFVLGGSFTEVYGQRSALMSPSTLIFRPSGEPHSDRFHATTRCFNIQMSEEWLGRLTGRSNVMHTPLDVQGGRSAHLAALLYREFREVDEFSTLAIEGLVLEIVAEVSRRSVKESDRKPPRWLEQVRAILCEQLSRKISLVALAESVDVHPAHLAREFRRFYRCTTGEYVRQRRIEFTCRQISASDAPFSEIALAAGFFDQSHFARTFKTYMGMAPGQYRTTLRRANRMQSRKPRARSR